MKAFPIRTTVLRSFILSIAGSLLATPALADWPQAAGPDGNWQGHGPPAPVQWSVTRDQNILWRTALPNGGQSGMAISGGRVFLTTFDIFKDGGSKFSGSILGHCLDALTGKLLWSVKLHGPTESPMLYAYSDSTSPTPVTDGKHVWFTNNSGEMGCWNFDGKEIWRRSFTPWGKPYPFNKQHEPMLVGDTIINVEPSDGNPPMKSGWNYLRGLDKLTGKTRWIADDGTTTYCTSVFGHTANGQPAVLTGRGGHHGVPERPVGLSLVSLSPGTEGKTLWRYVADTDDNGQPLKEPGSLDAPTWQALYTLHWNAKEAYWFRLNPEETHLVIDSQTGKLLREQSLILGVDYRQWDPTTKKHIVHENVNLRDMRELAPRNLLAPDEVIRVLPAWHCNIVLNGYHYFLTTTAHRRNRHAPKGRGGPSHCIARVNVTTGKVEYFEVPVTVIRKPGVPDEPVYGVAVRTTTLNSAGQDIAAEDRSRTDGWEIPAFWGSPVAINDNIYVTTMLGITYVIDSKAPVLDASALLAVNDLGPSGETWSLNSISYDGGRIYHRSLKELVCIGQTQTTSKAPKSEPTNATEAAAQKARADAEIDLAYQALVAKLPTDQQAWERVLQSQLGGFYLPIHKKEKIAGRSNAWDFVADDPKLPRVLLIGDSVSRGYTQAIRKIMEGKANIHRAQANCGPTASGLKNIDVWLGDGKWDVIHFNFGIHDRSTPLADYTQRLEQLIVRMEKTGAKLIWASTTPIPDTPDGKQTAASIIERNQAAAAVMKKHQIATDDLFSAITPHLGEMQNPNDVHFNAKGYDFLGQTVAAFIQNALK